MEGRVCVSPHFNFSPIEERGKPFIFRWFFSFLGFRGLGFYFLFRFQRRKKKATTHSSLHKFKSIVLKEVFYFDGGGKRTAAEKEPHTSYLFSSSLPFFCVTDRLVFFMLPHLHSSIPLCYCLQQHLDIYFTKHTHKHNNKTT